MPHRSVCEGVQHGVCFARQLFFVFVMKKCFVFCQILQPLILKCLRIGNERMSINTRMKIVMMMVDKIL